MNNSRLKHIQNWPELARAAKWSATALAKDCGVSVRTLERHFLKEMGKSPKQWMSDQRQHWAFELVQDGSSVKETAGLLDYKHPSHLSNSYKNHFGHYPMDKSVTTRLKSP